MIRKLYPLAICLTLFGCATNPPTPYVENLTIPEPEYLVSGNVSLNGQPVNGMLVEAYTGDCFNGPVIAKTTTDAEGAFSFKDMQPATYFIGLNEFRGNGKLIPDLTSTCGKGRAFTGKENLHFQLSVDKRK